MWSEVGEAPSVRGASRCKTPSSERLAVEQPTVKKKLYSTAHGVDDHVLMTRWRKRPLNDSAARAPQTERISDLLRPFLREPLESAQLRAISTYLDLLLRWNARLNLTAVREPEHIVTRHMGESLFAAAHLLPPDSTLSVIDVGSGAGFPGLPLKIYAPGVRLVLVEPQQRKATFLKEVIRALHLSEAEVFAGRAETFHAPADVVTLRAVERFQHVLPVAASLLRPADLHRDPANRLNKPPSRLALLIGATQVGLARDLLPRFKWEDPIPMPLSSARTLLVGVPE